jgi:hypothetical protein
MRTTHEGWWDGDKWRINTSIGYIPLSELERVTAWCEIPSCPQPYDAKIKGAPVGNDSRCADRTETLERYETCFSRIAQAIGIETPLQITAEAENDEENTAEILTRMVEKFTAK